VKGGNLQQIKHNQSFERTAKAPPLNLVVRAPEKTVNYGWQTAPGMTFPSMNKEVPREE